DVANLLSIWSVARPSSPLLSTREHCESSFGYRFLLVESSFGNLITDRLDLTDTSCLVVFDSNNKSLDIRFIKRCMANSCLVDLGFKTEWHSLVTAQS